jgi:type IV pilus assembly protein PilC
MKFNYVVLDAQKKIKKGAIDAQNLREATKLLIGQGWYIRKLVPQSHFTFSLAIFGRGVSLIDKTLFVKHLSTMIKSGIPITEALEVIAEQTTSRKFRNVVIKISEKVRTGQSLAASMTAFPRVFDPMITNIVEVGESSGTLEENLEFLAEALSDRLDLRRNIKTATFYPLIVLSATFILGLILAYFVMPKISRLFKSLSFKMPLPTLILIKASDIMDKYGIFVVVGSIGAFMLAIFLTRQKFFQPVWHRLLIWLPVISPVVINYNLVLLTRTLSVLLKSGVPIDNAIVITAETTGNIVYKKKLRKSLEQIQKGKKFADVLDTLEPGKKKLFPLLIIKMIGVGERSGRLDESLMYLADFYQKESDNQTKNLTTVLEPMLLLFVGLVVGFVAVSVIMPIYQVTSQLGR